MSDPIIQWGALLHDVAGINSLRVNGSEVARLQRRVDGAGWMLSIGMHREWLRQTRWSTAEERQARRMAERWTRAHLQRLVVEIAARDAMLKANRRG